MGSTLPELFDAPFRVLSFGFRVRTRVASAAALVGEVLAPFRSDDLNGLPLYEVVDDHGEWAPFAALFEGESIREHTSAEEVIDYLFWHINYQAIKRTTDFLVLHAAAASWSDRGVLLPARMDSGKTTLVAGLTRAGFSYLTDEATRIDPQTAWMLPYPKPLWMEDGSVAAIPGLAEELRQRPGRRVGAQYHVRPEDLRAGAVGGPCRVAYVITPAYKHGASTVLTPMSRAEAILMLAENSFNFRRFGSSGLDLLSRAVGDAECFRLEIGSLDEAVRTVKELMET